MNTSEIKQTEISFVKQLNGPTLGYSPASGLALIQQDGFFFKNLSRSGCLEIFEDWRLPAIERATDLAKRLTKEEMAGLMVYSCMIHVPNDRTMTLHSRKHTFHGKSFSESHLDTAAVSDQLKDNIEKDHMRHFFIGGCCSTEAMVEWNNRIQTLAEKQPYGIPCIKATDPRHSKVNMSKILFQSGEDFTVWTEGVGLAAAGDLDIAYTYGRTVAKEYRALGIQCILGPQIDLATDPRWARYRDTFGPNTQLTTALAKRVIDGFQTSEDDSEIEHGWGTQSIYAIAKHWPGGGTGEGGRDAHYGLGKYAVYPGNNFKEHLKPFIEGAFKLDGPTQKAAGIMPYYSVSYQQDLVHGENVGNGFSQYIVKDLLQNQYHYDGIICSDWEITTDTPAKANQFAGKCWGVELLTVAERMKKALLIGINQFGGLNSSEALVRAYDLIAASEGEEIARQLFEKSTIKLLENIFRLGMFENPYLDLQYSKQCIGNDRFVDNARNEQAKATVLLKNTNNLLPLKPGQRVYAPQLTPPYPIVPIDTSIFDKYFVHTSNPDDADFGFIYLNGPIALGTTPNPFDQLSSGYDVTDLQSGGNGYIPISLQYRPYKALHARKVSIAGDIMNGTPENRSYYEKIAKNDEHPLDLLIQTKQKLGSKPLVVVIGFHRPSIVAEFEKYADAIFIDYGIEDEVLMELITGVRVPGGKLPYTIPLDMATVELHHEDMDDLNPYLDSDGNLYQFGFGLLYTHRKEG